MARKGSTENPTPALSSQDEEEEKQNDNEEEQTDVKSSVVVDRHNSSSDSEDDDSDNTIPSPNISDFTIKPIINKPGSKRLPPTPESESMKMKKKKKEEEEEEERTVDGEEAPIIVLGLPRQQAATASGRKSASKGRAGSEVTVKRRQLDKGRKVIDGKSKKLMEKMLEMYIKRTDLVHQQTKLLLEELKSEKI